jgi:hypothetical protein
MLTATLVGMARLHGEKVLQKFSTFTTRRNNETLTIGHWEILGAGTEFSKILKELRRNSIGKPLQCLDR